TVDVVCAERHASNLLRHEVHFVRGLRAREDPERIRSVSIDVAPKSSRCPIKRLVPTCRTKDASLPDHWLRQPVVGASRALSLVHDSNYDAMIKNIHWSTGIGATHARSDIGMLAQVSPMMQDMFQKKPAQAAAVVSLSACSMRAGDGGKGLPKRARQVTQRK